MASFIDNQPATASLRITVTAPIMRKRLRNPVAQQYVLELPDMWKRSDQFEERFTRCRKLLYLIACRILDRPSAAEVAVEKCRLVASRSSRTFETEGAFRSWLARVLINEAVTLRRAKAKEAVRARTPVGKDQPRVRES
jgi:DNA-directed RNA polymerase specialized sigma24 family protein